MKVFKICAIIGTIAMVLTALDSIVSTYLWYRDAQPKEESSSDTGQKWGVKYPYLLEPRIPLEVYRQVVSSLPYRSIELERSPCFGTCPVYRLVLSSDGRARYEGYENVEMMGVHTGEVDFASFAHLCNAIERLNIKEMDDDYSAGWTDDSSTTITLFGDGTNVVKRVNEYGGVGPIELWVLQQGIEAVGRSVEWNKTEETAKDEPECSR